MLHIPSALPPTTTQVYVALAHPWEHFHLGAEIRPYFTIAATNFSITKWYATYFDDLKNIIKAFEHFIANQEYIERKKEKEREEKKK